VIPLVLVGAAGRMGRAVEQAAGEAGGFEIHARVERPGSLPASGAAAGRWSASAGEVVRAGDVVIDFSGAPAVGALATLCAERGAPLVSGTTGLSSADEAVIAEAAKRVAVLRAANFSLGVAALQRALDAALTALPSTWDVEIVERHHRRKLDSPSGTALALARRVQAVRGGAAAIRHGRSGATGERPAAEIGMHSLRGGTWVGDHTVLIAGEGEWIELRHVAQDRAAFASGALAAARFVAQARPGLYTVDDLLGDR
jgi:4-hydroxy-tetrahydrodipicolinate reductase